MNMEVKAKIEEYIGENVGFAYYCSSGYGFGIGTLENISDDGVRIKNGPPIMTFNSININPTTVVLSNEKPVVLITNLSGEVIYISHDHFRYYPENMQPFERVKVLLDLQQYIEENRRKYLGNALNKIS